MDVKVSVILPSLNVADYIKECLDSVINQTLLKLEIICVDAGSTDGTKEILNDYRKSDSRIVLLHSDIKSYGKQVNMGLEYATGEYIAILETDDWITSDMYEYLYEHAVSGDFDYVSTDFDMFWQLQNGKYYFVRQHLFGPEKQDWYGRGLNSDEIATLRTSDYVLWKGIYNRSFLNTNNIRLHESPGAAFQDMGFLQQVKTYAEKAAYFDRSFYKYRQDREGASSISLKGLQYYRDEFLWINNSLKLQYKLKGVHKKYYYYTMSIAFIGKYEQILIKLNGEWQNEKLGIPYGWFKREVSNAIERGVLEKAMYGKDQWEQLTLLLSSQELYAHFIMERENKKRTYIQKLIDIIANRSVVIFGCGIRGERLMRFCDSYQICIHAFCDNNTELHGKRKYGFPIISPTNLKTQVNEKNEAVLLSMKNGREEVHRQLTEMGIEHDRMIEEIPDEIF